MNEVLICFAQFVLVVGVFTCIKTVKDLISRSFDIIRYNRKKEALTAFINEMFSMNPQAIHSRNPGIDIDPYYGVRVHIDSMSFYIHENQEVKRLREHLGLGSHTRKERAKKTKKINLDKNSIARIEHKC